MTLGPLPCFRFPFPRWRNLALFAVRFTLPGERNVNAENAVVRTRYRSLQDPENLRELVQRLREGIYVTTRAGEVVDANPACLEILGVKSLAELSGLGASRLLVDPKQRERELELLDRDGAIREFELQLRRPDGQVRTVL